ncbi:hypothetical protein SeMB42_g06403 [Synchytrium endobioticum]|uniref:Uncharacterized protein n=1 Tax=Synchytrium endobioticum TaxID=286115 RepID=A0A507CCJ0_9FUNG|nr:hypothetical protein SeMB42_g06403 [Synchytrium endobioticum]
MFGCQTSIKQNSSIHISGLVFHWSICTPSFSMLTILFVMLLVLQPFHIARAAHTDYTEADLRHFTRALIEHKWTLTDHRIDTLCREFEVFFGRLLEAANHGAPGGEIQTGTMIDDWVMAKAIPEGVRFTIERPTEDMSMRYMEFCSEGLVNVHDVVSRINEKSMPLENAPLKWMEHHAAEHLQQYCTRLGRVIYGTVIGYTHGFHNPDDNSFRSQEPAVIRRRLGDEINRVVERTWVLGRTTPSPVSSLTQAFLTVVAGFEWCLHGSRPVGVPDSVGSPHELHIPAVEFGEIMNLWKVLAAAKLRGYLQLQICASGTTKAENLERLRRVEIVVAFRALHVLSLLALPIVVMVLVLECPPTHTLLLLVVSVAWIGLLVSSRQQDPPHQDPVLAVNVKGTLVNDLHTLRNDFILLRFFASSANFTIETK